jgi:alanyl-tRNA synthetase
LNKIFDLNSIRKLFLDFFKNKDHKTFNSLSLVPQNDDSLLLINSGMAPYKKYFSGEEVAVYKRIVSCQKCIRTNDIDNVGKTSRHATFFEMLGNFSFGDYFKREAIHFAWEFLTKILEIDKRKLFVTVFKDDLEAYEIWCEILDRKKIFRLDKKDNFWEIDKGPCGPCSEIYYYRGDEFNIKCENRNCGPGCNCDNYIEIWNLVFTQFNKISDDEYLNLSQKNIDTGMGLERIVAVLQKVNYIFDIEENKIISNEIFGNLNFNYGNSKKVDVAVRIIMDHIKAAVFMISDDIYPSNDGRGYVLRKLLRRAMCKIKILDIKNNILESIAIKYMEFYCDCYGEIENKKSKILDLIKQEKNKFDETLNLGIEKIKSIIFDINSDDKKNRIISGEEAFRLYDTHGFPLEIVQEFADDSNCEIDSESFYKKVNEQREKSRSNNKKNEDKINQVLIDLLKSFGETKFLYDTEYLESSVVAIIDENILVKKINIIDKKILIVLRESIFFAESAGQTFDTGILRSKTGEIKIVACYRIGNKFLHECVLINGEIFENQDVEMILDKYRRKSISRNHTATHLLHRALKKILNKNIRQMGSSVDEKKLRFDFNYEKELNNIDLIEIEDFVNKKISKCANVDIFYKNIDEAKKSGAIALFDNKYGDVVRVVNIDDFSMEMCSGTHVKNTSEILGFKIINKKNISVGIKRIEAITGDSVRNYYIGAEKKLLEKINYLEIKEKKTNEEIKKFKSKEIKIVANNLINNCETFKNKISFIFYLNKEIDQNKFKLLIDNMKNKKDNCVIFLFNDDNLTALSNINNFDINDLILNLSREFNFKGGGNKNYAKAGGIDISLHDRIINKTREVLKNLNIKF